MNYIVGIDIGGTKVAIGIVGEDGKLYHHTKIATDLSISPKEMIHRLSEAINHLVKTSGISFEQVLGIGIGAPGPLDSKRGIITCPPNLPNWHNVEIVCMLEELYQIPVRLENDCNAATLAEKWIGASQNNDYFVYVTISTGIGAGIFADGRLISGKSGNAGDIGHIMMDPTYGTCTCGQNGCFEWIASGTAIARQGSEILGQSVTAEEVFTLYRNKDPRVQDLINNIFTVIGAGCTTIVNAFDPEKVVIGGGVSKVGEPLFQAVRSYVQTHALSPSGRETEIVTSGLDHHSGTIGAAALLLQDKGALDEISVH
ncbi:ROK family protein [Halobacillus sp. BBL2006]|uniref:ROK family protein n=1 Tax=Halobacillus sp. BBL2006 TaxID=1543706 RepID=UPI000543C395|nr:ROK family protein [Halobacillus sp. BBL2006]KHE72310.1 transcriptional regulator [Halobacillus sp. BBL2006]